MNYFKPFVGTLVVGMLAIAACTSPETTSTLGNPAADGFNESGSDAKAIAIADEVMKAMGGRMAWDNNHRS